MYVRIVVVRLLPMHIFVSVAGVTGASGCYGGVCQRVVDRVNGDIVTLV